MRYPVYFGDQCVLLVFLIIFREVVLIGGESVKDQIRQLQEGVSMDIITIIRKDDDIQV